ncbi:MAG TPA: hypothetical protein PK843_11615 [bacterium]|nr:hypothetical protein [bacterium]HPN35154.1 hypothetical protein [bacterium]
MPTAKKTTPKVKPKGKPKVKTATKKAPAAKKPAPASKALTDLKARLAAIEAKLAKSDNLDKIKTLEEKIAVNSTEVQKLKHGIADWEHKVDRKIDLLHDTVQGVSGKVEALIAEQEALEQAVASSPPPEKQDTTF